jgi:hypothetical protein
VLNAGLLGGGGGGVVPTSCPGNCISCPGDFTCVYNTGRAGCAGGAGSPSCLSSSIPGTPGVVIIYW